MIKSISFLLGCLLFTATYSFDSVQASATVDSVRKTDYFSHSPKTGFQPLSLISEDDFAPLSIIYRDENHDQVPDFMDSVIVVSGRANTATRLFHERYLQSYVQNDSVGISIFSEQIGKDFNSGDSLIVRGRVSTYMGLIELEVIDYLVIPNRGQMKPLPIFDARTALEYPEIYRCMLVEGDGIIKDVQDRYNGKYIEVQVGEQDPEQAAIYITNFHKQLAEFGVSSLSIGDHLHFRGVLTMFDMNGDGSLQMVITPRTVDDFAPEMFTRKKRLIMFGGLAILTLIAIAWVIGLRKQVRSKTKALNDTIDQRDDLIREIHHRIKNNLAVVSGLLQMQWEYTDSEEARNALDDSQKRIQSITKVHQQLYQSREGGEERIELAHYLSELIGSISYSMGAHESQIEVVNDFDNVKVTADQATYCGLLLNELLINSFKYAFPVQHYGSGYRLEAEESPKITVQLRYDPSKERVDFCVQDNGVGMSDPDPNAQETLGFRLIQTFVKQLRGDLTISSEPGEGMKAAIRFARN
jgi:two-component sensor histidine kinase